jgi:hypothetical protein
MHLALLVQEDDFQSTVTEPRHSSMSASITERRCTRTYGFQGMNERGGVDPGTLSSFQLSLELESLLPKAPLRGDPR